MRTRAPGGGASCAWRASHSPTSCLGTPATHQHTHTHSHTTTLPLQEPPDSPAVAAGRRRGGVGLPVVCGWRRAISIEARRRRHLPGRQHSPRPPHAALTTAPRLCHSPLLTGPSLCGYCASLWLLARELWAFNDSLGTSRTPQPASRTATRTLQSPESVFAPPASHLISLFYFFYRKY